MRLTRLDAFLIRVLYAMAALIVILQVLDQDALVSMVFYASFAVALALWLSAVCQKMELLDAVVLAAIAIALINVLLNAISANAALSFQYLKKYIIFAVTLLLFAAADKLRISTAVGHWINRTMTLASIAMTLTFFWKGQELYEMHGIVSNYLTFHFTNPNLVGLFLFCLAVYQFILLLYEHDLKRKLFHGVLFMFMAVFILKTQSRNTLLSLAVFLAIAVSMFRLNKRTVTVKKWACAFIAAWPLLFAGLYMQLYGNNVVGRMLSFVVSEGKLLDSRVKMWRFAMRWYKTSPVVGAYDQITEGLGAGQMHNTHIDILAAYGPMVLALVCIILYMLMRRGAANATRHPLYVIAFMCTIVMGMGEAALFGGSLGLYIFAVGFLLLSNMQQEEPSPSEAEVDAP